MLHTEVKPLQSNNLLFNPVMVIVWVSLFMVQYTNLHVIRFKGSSVNRNKFISKVLSIESKVLGPQYCLVFKSSSYLRFF